jgi:hypothetical protein
VNIDTLKRLAEKANSPYSAQHLANVTFLNDRQGFRLGAFEFETGDDTDFIVALVNAFPDLIARLEAAEAVCRLTDELTNYPIGRAPPDVGLDILQALKAWHSLTAGKEPSE